MEVKILVVDDEEAVRNVVGASLEKPGYNVDLADGVRSAMELMKSTEYDIIIMDKNMPDMDDMEEEGGMSLLKYTKMHAPTSEVIMMTGYPTIETAIEAMKLGVFDYITKPFSIEELHRKVERLLEYMSFINPENTIQAYRNLHIEILNLLENKLHVSDDELDKLLTVLGARIDQFFKLLKGGERIILLQKQALGNIETYAARLKDEMPEKDHHYSLVEMICKESSRRI